MAVVANTMLFRSSFAYKLLLALIYVLDGVNFCVRRLLACWCFLTGRRVRPPGSGSRPAPPKVIGVILAEPQTSDISLQKVAKVAAWCLMHSSVEQLHLYDPAGHLKRCQEVLQDSLQEAAAAEGRTLVLKCGWSVCRPLPQATWQQQQYQQQQLQQQLSLQQGPRRQQQQRTWSAWLTQQLIGAPQQQQQQQQQVLPQEQLRHQQSDQDITCPRQQLQEQHLQLPLLCQGRCQHPECVRRLTAGPAGAAVSGTDLCGATAGLMGHSANGVCLEQRADPSSDSHSYLYCKNDSSRDSSGSSNSSSGIAAAVDSAAGPSVTVRLLSAEDAYRPVIDASLVRSNGLGGMSPKALMPLIFRQQQQQQQDCWWDSSINSSKVTSRAAAGDPAAVQKQPTLQGDDQYSQQQQQHHREKKLAPDIPENDVQQHDQQRHHHQQSKEQQQQQQQQLKEQQQQLAKYAIVQQHTRQQCVLPELLELADPDILHEPELLLVFGPAATLAGYPPFHSRGCEIHHLGSLAAAHRQGVFDALAKYCNVLQRHGA